VTDYVDTAIKDIEERINAIKDEVSRLEAARAALTGGRSRRGRRASTGTARTPSRSIARRNGHAPAPRARRGGNTRANQALELVRSQPGITIPEIAKAMKIQPNYLYRVLPRLASDGEIKREGQGWHPGSGSTSTPSPAKSPRRARGTKSPQPRSAASAKGRRSARTSTATNGRTGRGATTASVLAALAGGEAMTASQVATKAGLARPSVSTTLSKLAKSGAVQKADRGYRLTPAG
jgi:DNA-binding IscR family transcriptional regulator